MTNQTTPTKADNCNCQNTPSPERSDDWQALGTILLSVLKESQDLADEQKLRELGDEPKDPTGNPLSVPYDTSVRYD